ncbi:hypothetical protein KBC04_03385 [Candidatus Babeliales bacterium]|nr:hypothetical protein [Candidatus Babeliales bacterium]MBP9843905.1 hypothetical protein [Candidatus Babeliales bacterium]
MINNKKFIIFLWAIIVGQSTHASSLRETPRPEFKYETDVQKDQNKNNETTRSKSLRKKNPNSRKPVEREHIVAEEQKRIEKREETQQLRPRSESLSSQNIQEIFLKENEQRMLLEKANKEDSAKDLQAQPTKAQDITLVERTAFIEPSKKTETPEPQPQEKSIQDLFTPLTEQPSISMQSVIEYPAEMLTKFDTFISKMTLSVLKKSINVNINSKLFHTSFADIIAESLKRYMFQLFQLPENLNTETDAGNSLNNFKMEIQFLAYQIGSYNGKQFYTQPEQMLALIKIINRFLQEADAHNISQEISKKLDLIYQQAKKACNLFQNQNIIFSTKDTPEQILQFFLQPIKNTNNLTKIQFSYGLIHKIYDAHGYMDQILQAWQEFQHSNLYKNKINREYGAFIAFLLIFQNSIVAAANILDETSALYQVTNPIPITININEGSSLFEQEKKLPNEIQFLLD